jgi:hypothetical protein
MGLAQFDLDRYLGGDQFENFLAAFGEDPVLRCGNDQAAERLVVFVL